MDTESTITDRDDTGHADAAATNDADTDQSTEVVDELLIEEISIDGMCGVY